MIAVYLVVASVNDFAPVASRVIRWASAWNRPVLSAVTMVYLAWTWRGQAQWLWSSARALVHRHILRPCPATRMAHCTVMRWCTAHYEARPLQLATFTWQL